MDKLILPSYSVAIRTLGKAGTVYQNLLNSIALQSHQPEKIVVYLAHGYEKPKETIGIEEIVYVPKGMVTQRALDYKEIDSEFILLLDDDVLLAPDSVVKMLKGLMDFGGDYCVADTFHTSNRSFKSLIKGFCKQLTYSRHDDGWGVKICPNGSCSFNNHPSCNIVKTESGAGPASLWRRQAFLDIHFEDEVWIDRFSYPLGEDQLLFYKVIVNGAYGLLCYDSGIEHIDAQTSQGLANMDSNKTLFRSQLRYIVWYRSIYEPSKSSVEKMKCKLAYGVLSTLISIQHLALSIVKLSPKPFTQFVKGQRLAKKYVKSEEYNEIPKYKLHR